MGGAPRGPFSDPAVMDVQSVIGRSSTASTPVTCLWTPFRGGRQSRASHLGALRDHRPGRRRAAVSLVAPRGSAGPAPGPHQVFATCGNADTPRYPGGYRAVLHGTLRDAWVVRRLVLDADGGSAPSPR